MIQNNEYFRGRLLPQHLTLQIALIDAHHQRYSNVVLEHSFGQGQGELSFVLFLLVGVVDSCLGWRYFSLPF